MNELARYKCKHKELYMNEVKVYENEYAYIFYLSCDKCLNKIMDKMNGRRITQKRILFKEG